MRIDRSDMADGPGDAQVARCAPDSDSSSRAAEASIKKSETIQTPDDAAPRDRSTPDKPARVTETRSRGEIYADTRQTCESGWERQRLFDAPRIELAGFRTERAGLPETSPKEADRYIEDHRAERPWLRAAEYAAPESRRIIAAIDRGTGHGHIRHEGWATEEANMRRAAFLEDPAQLDATKRLHGIDGLRPDDKRHKCADTATRITDPDAFATAFARGAEHSRVRTALSTPYEPGVWPNPVRVPIADLLGDEGHNYCTGWQLEPVAGNMDAAMSNRRAWRTAMAEAHEPDVPQPMVRPVPTFEGGTLFFVVGHNETRDGYEIVNMYPEPRDDDLPAS